MTDFKKLMDEKTYLQIPKVDDIVKGKVVSITKSAVHIDLEGYRTGVVRGPELRDESNQYADLKVGDEVEATVGEKFPGAEILIHTDPLGLEEAETVHELEPKI